MLSYRQLLEELYARQSFGVQLGLERVREALARLGNPQASIGAAIHIGGTNGKGSTAAMVESMSRAGGAKTGLFTSPHLSRFVERICIDGEPIDPERLASIWADCRDACRDLTFFECSAVLAFCAFRQAGTQVAVIEVGLGGRLDATNVLERPACTVITSIALDHMGWLGATVEEIAAEKAGIFKPGVPAFVAASSASALAVLEASAASRGAVPLRRLGHELWPFAVGSEEERALRLRGAHQRANGALAWAAVEQLPTSVRPSRAARLAGLASVVWPGRLELLRDYPALRARTVRPALLLDVAHNGEGAEALAAALAERATRPDLGRRHLVLGLLDDKDPAAVLSPLLGSATGSQFDRVVCTKPPSPRALAADELRRRAETVLQGIGAPYAGVESVAEPIAAVERALEGLSARDALVVCGSVYLVGRVRSWALEESSDPLNVGDPLSSRPR